MYRWGQEEIDAVARVIQSGSLFRINSKYNEVGNFEKALLQMVGTKYALCVTSGTAALATSLAALGIGPGDEVIIPGYTFIATASAILSVGAIPVLCEIDETLTMDPIDMENKISSHTKAIIPVHLRGFPCDMDRITEISKKHNLYVIEDACQANGGSYKGKRLGSFGEFGTFSYNWYKIISAGEGGALVTNNPKAFERAIIYADPGANFWLYDQPITTPYFVAQNYRVSEITGAVLRVQLGRLDGILFDLRKVRNTIMSALDDKVCFAPSYDRNGDCGYTLPIQFDDIGTAESFAKKYDEGDPRPINTGKHVYRNWTSLMEKRVSHSDKVNPFFNPLNKGLNMEFSPESLPRTIELLSRTVYIDINPDWIYDDIAVQIDRVLKAL